MKNRDLAIIMLFAFMACITGFAPSSAFAKGKKKIVADVKLEITACELLTENRGNGSIYFVGVTKKGKTIEGKGMAMFSVIQKPNDNEYEIDANYPIIFVAEAEYETPDEPASVIVSGLTDPGELLSAVTGGYMEASGTVKLFSGEFEFDLLVDIKE